MHIFLTIETQLVKYINIFYCFSLVFDIIFTDINAAILQGQYFAVERPNYINYASIGAVIGHEINHGFDSEVSIFSNMFKI